ncbi:probable aspartyl protease At4g16563 [Vigna radiata var. radiata]|uniref:Probable aspartyl protease At4g16563 n=1 Tax=Vigna radiata var. radiata TaxID=3916 RepID=A0A1S3TN20_VIGRR|nr:probable aspartyl protease At4g16563 [Vigna radiata var. radiata]
MALPNYIILLSLTLISHTALTSSTIILPLSPLLTKPQSSGRFQSLKLAASASLTRAHHLKHRQNASSVATTQVYPKSYGGYSIDLNFGTPPQTSPFVLDTGSSLVWFPCTTRYICSHCLFPNIDPTKIHTFIPKNSSTAKLLGCRNPKCGYLFGSDLQSRCPQCQPNSQNCSVTCPPYIIEYGLGSTAGFLLLDNLNFPSKIVPQFLVGCSILSIRQPSGIAGFGRGQDSLPSQMALKRFSYCLLSHSFDDSTENSDLVLHISSTGDTKTNGLSYTPFHPNPSASNPAFLEYYYLSLRKVIVGGKKVKIPFSFLDPGSDGHGGTIVDSGSTFTFMERPVYDLVAQEFVKQLGNFSRAEDVEAQSGLGPCFNTSGAKTVNFPEFTFQFKGGAKMTLPVENYFSLIDDSEVVCLTVVSDGGAGPAKMSGPAIILGNYQQQNFHIEYDLENERFGFGPQSCKKKT